MFLNEIEFANKWVVLCVDDEADGLFLRAQILERFGYAVIASTHPLREGRRGVTTLVSALGAPYVAYMQKRKRLVPYVY